MFKKRALTFISLTLCLSCASKKEGPLTTEEEAAVDKVGIRKTFFTYRKSLSDCYGQALLVKGQEELKGVMALRFDIDANGRAQNISQVSEKSTLQNESLKTCLVDNLKAWEFPSHPSGKVVTVIYPVAFSEAPPQNLQNKLDQFEKVKEPSKKP